MQELAIFNYTLICCVFFYGSLFSLDEFEKFVALGWWVPLLEPDVVDVFSSSNYRPSFILQQLEFRRSSVIQSLRLEKYI